MFTLNSFLPNCRAKGESGSQSRSSWAKGKLHFLKMRCSNCHITCWLFFWQSALQNRIVEVQGFVSVSVLQWLCHLLSYFVIFCECFECLKAYKTRSATGQAEGGSQGTVELSVKPWSRNGMVSGKVCSLRTVRGWARHRIQEIDKIW